MSGVAYDAAYPPVGEICASDALFVCCYTDGDYATPVGTINAYRAAGKGILPNHERGAGDLLRGYGAGVQAANQCMANVAGWQCPQDGSVAIFYSVDLAVPGDAFGVIGEAFDGINDTHAGRWKTGVYGEGALIDFLAATGRVHVKGWLSASSSYPGWNPDSPNVGMWQMVGTDIPGTDQNVVTDPAGLGVWWPVGVVPSGGGNLEDDMGVIGFTATDDQGAGWYVSLADNTKVYCGDPNGVAAASAGSVFMRGHVASAELARIPSKDDWLNSTIAAIKGIPGGSSGATNVTFPKYTAEFTPEAS